MDHALRRYGNWVLETLGTRIPRLPKDPPKLRIPSWAWIAPLGLLLSVWAHKGSQEEGRISWFIAHPPSQASWKNILSERGFAPIEDPVWREKAYAEMPEISRIKASALISEDRHTVAVREGGEWLYFELKGAPGKGVPGQVVARELWEGLGIGWEAIASFEKTELPLIRTAEASARTKEKWQDSRSLDY